LHIQGKHPTPFLEEIITLPILQTSKEFELVLETHSWEVELHVEFAICWGGVLWGMI